MSQDEDLSREEQEKIARIRSESLKALNQRPLWDLAMIWADYTARLGPDDPVAYVLGTMEDTASFILSVLVPELQGVCDLDEMRAWSLSVKESELDPPEETPEGKREREILVDAVAVIAYTAFCRAALESGDARAAAWGMHQATRMYRLIHSEFDAPLIEKGRQWLAGGERGRKKISNAREKERRIWLGEYRRLRAQHPHWRRNKIAEEIGRTAKPPRDRTTVLRFLKSLEKGTPADS